MGPKQKRPATSKSNRQLPDAWAIRAVVILQGIAVIVGIITIPEQLGASQILESFLKILELIAQAP